MSKKIYVKPLTFLGLVFLGSQSAFALDCNSGSNLTEFAQQVVGVQEGAETLDDINVNLGIIPEAIISDKVREITSSASELNDGISTMRDVCTILAPKTDPIDRYFTAVNLLFSNTPMASWVSMDVEIGKKIVADANSIVSNGVNTLLHSDGLTAVIFKLQLDDNDFFAWRSNYKGYKIINGNYISSIGFLCRNKQSRKIVKVDTYADMEKTIAGNNNYSADTVVIGTGDDLINSCSFEQDDVFLNVLWNNNQRTLVPVTPNYYTIGNKQLVFKFGKGKDSYIVRSK